MVIPTYNAGTQWIELLTNLKNQSSLPQSIVVIDSSSTDDTVNIARKYGCTVIDINRDEFNHGKTRQNALRQINNIELVVYLTQDAILANTDALQKIVYVFRDSSIGASYGRQIPRKGAGYLEKFERLYNYPELNQTKEFSDIDKYGMKTAFISNSFAAFRIKALQEVGGFPSNVILAEDMYVAAKMLMAGWSIYYCSEATVYHSHNYNLRELFGRYFDTGVYHNREPWIQENFGKAGGEGKKFVLSEIRFLWGKKPRLIPYAILRNIVKWLGYRIGLWEDFLPRRLKRALSMHTNFWN